MDLQEVVAGRYRVGRRLASGGISHVWLAVDETDGSTVAIKRLLAPAGLSAAESTRVRALSLPEARAFARIDHPNVVRIRDVVPDGDEPWIVMDYIPSRSLQEVVTSSGAMHPRRVAEIGLQMLRGLNGVFEADVLHLDVKPGNVLIAEDGRVLLSDFGPAVTEAGVRALTDAKMILGSLNYVAPERLFDGVSTRQADLWSLGATLYFAVEGRQPFRRDTKDEKLAALRGREPDPLLRAGPLTEVIRGLMRAEPEDRLSIAAAERLLLGMAGSGSPPVTGPARKTRPKLLAAAIAAVTVVAAGTTAVVRNGDQAEARMAAPPAPAASAVVPPASRLPAGYTWRTGKAGFRVAAPTRWAVTDAGGVFTARAPAGGPVLRVRAWAAADPVAGLIALESRTRPANYRRMRIAPATDPPGAVWEYTYKTSAGAALRVQEEVVRADGRTYRITWLCPRDDWSDALDAWNVVLGGFDPRGGA